MFVCGRWFDKNIFRLSNESFAAFRRDFLNSEYKGFWNLSKPILLEKNPWLQMAEMHHLFPKPNIQLGEKNQHPQTKQQKTDFFLF